MGRDGGEGGTMGRDEGEGGSMGRDEGVRDDDDSKDVAPAVREVQHGAAPAAPESGRAALDAAADGASAGEDGSVGDVRHDAAAAAEETPGKGDAAGPISMAACEPHATAREVVGVEVPAEPEGRDVGVAAVVAAVAAVAVGEKAQEQEGRAGAPTSPLQADRPKDAEDGTAKSAPAAGTLKEEDEDVSPAEVGPSMTDQGAHDPAVVDNEKKDERLPLSAIIAKAQRAAGAELAPSRTPLIAVISSDDGSSSSDDGDDGAAAAEDDAVRKDPALASGSSDFVRKEVRRLERRHKAVVASVRRRWACRPKSNAKAYLRLPLLSGSELDPSGDEGGLSEVEQLQEKRKKVQRLESMQRKLALIDAESDDEREREEQRREEEAAAAARKKEETERARKLAVEAVQEKRRKEQEAEEVRRQAALAAIAVERQRLQEAAAAALVDSAPDAALPIVAEKTMPVRPSGTVASVPGDAKVAVGVDDSPSQGNDNDMVGEGDGVDDAGTAAKSPARDDELGAKMGVGGEGAMEAVAGAVKFVSVTPVVGAPTPGAAASMALHVAAVGYIADTDVARSRGGDGKPQAATPRTRRRRRRRRRSRPVGRRKQLPHVPTAKLPPVLARRRKRVPDERNALLWRSIQREQVVIGTLQVACAAFAAPLRAMETKAPLAPNIYPIAVLFDTLESVIRLLAVIRADLVAGFRGGLDVDWSRVAAAVTERRQYFPLLLRYARALSQFQEAIAQKQRPPDTEKFAALTKLLMQQAVRLAAEVPELQDAELGPDFDGWLSSPLTQLGELRTLFEMLVAKTSEEDVAARAVLETCVAFLKEALTHVDATTVEQKQMEYHRLVFKKFKSSCPLLFSPTRIYVNRYVFKQVKTRKTDFLPRFVDDDDDDDDDNDDNGGGDHDHDRVGRDAGSVRSGRQWSLRRSTSSTSSIRSNAGGFARSLQDIVRQKHKKAGSDVKMYLFNDAVLISVKRLGRRTCRDFVPLSGLTVFDIDERLDIFGLKFTGKGGAPVCQVYKAASLAAKQDFLQQLQQEMAISVQLRSEATERVQQSEA